MTYVRIYVLLLQYLLMKLNSLVKTTHCIIILYNTIWPVDKCIINVAVPPSEIEWCWLDNLSSIQVDERGETTAPPSISLTLTLEGILELDVEIF